ncbi:class I SAM-dependent methyltransferase [Candidatus Uhrbacteria bacterium]|nr:class I SAM-dependent methyltransferase [Candidatus Uhrbacteria bacterium]
MDIRKQLLDWWGKCHVGEQIRNRAVRRAMRELARPGTRLLDAGCGRGENARWAVRRWPAIRVDALDIDPKVVERLRGRLRETDLTGAVRVEVGDVTALTTRAQYGIVYTVDVLEHVRDPGQALTQFAAVLEPGGWCIVHVPAIPQRRWFHRFASYAQEDHVREGFAPDTLTALLRASGFQVMVLRRTFGPPGALAWELFQILQRIARPLVLVAYPVLWVLVVLDGRWRSSWGNGCIAVARKRTHTI